MYIYILYVCVCVTPRHSCTLCILLIRTRVLNATGFVGFQAKRTKTLLTAAFHKRLTEDEKSGVEYITLCCCLLLFCARLCIFFFLEAFARLLLSSDTAITQLLYAAF